MSIRMAPPPEPASHQATMPLATSRRWNSPYDGDGEGPLVEVFLSQPAYCRVHVHAASEPDAEVGGALVGKWCSDPDSQRDFVLVEHAMPARYTRAGSVYLTFTQDTIVSFHRELEQKYPEKQIVGWYHTHPRMGIFLSHYDTWLHGHFFPESWQLALVVEPHSSTGGFFIRQQEGILSPTRYFGFYELNGSSGRSAVRWNNLQSVESTTEGS